MTTDSWPQEFRYISKRLVREIVQQHEAAGRSWTADSADVSVTPARVGFRKRRPDPDNPYDLARRATQAVSDNTGTLEVGGSYVRGELELKLCQFPVLLGLDRSHSPVASVCHVGESANGTRTVVAMFGSIENYIGSKRRRNADGGGFFPSDIAGLYGIVELAREPRDARPDSDRIADDEELDDLAVCEIAIHFAIQSEPFQRARFSFLAKTHLHLSDALIDGKRYATVLVGTPIWVATPSPRAWTPGQPPFDR